jgi:CO/xanthine dehydrogenase Mo-binding subunit
MRVKTGVKNDGAITAMHFQSYLDGGAYGSYGVASTFYTGALQTVTYDVPRYKFQGLRTFTNKAPCGPKRGHGTPQPRYALEVHLDKIAEQLKLDPVEIRRRHLVAPDSVTANYLRIGSMGLGQCIDKVVEGSRWHERFSWDQANRKLPFGKGIGIACSSYICGAGLPIYWNNMPQSGVQLRLDRQGGVCVMCGSTDIGQGSDSILAYIVAEILGIDPFDIRVITADTDLTPVDLGSYSSRVTLMTGNAAIQAAERARDCWCWPWPRSLVFPSRISRSPNGVCSMLRIPRLGSHLRTRSCWRSRSLERLERLVLTSRRGRRVSTKDRALGHHRRTATRLLSLKST